MNESRPNLIYVFADQLRRDACGYAGSKYALTPNIDSLASECIDMVNAISGHPVCAPYRASLFTGKYTTSTGMVINEIRLNPDHRCIAHVLADAGYEKEYVGKWHLYANQLGHHEEVKNSFVPQGPDRLGFDGFFAHYGFHHEYYAPHAYYHLDTPEKIYHEGYEPDCMTDLAMQRLEKLSKGSAPFAFFLSLGTPHDPWNRENVKPDCWERVKDLEFTLPENYLDENDPYADNWAVFRNNERSELTEWMRGYYGMVANLDDNIGRLMNKIKELGLDKNSIIVFTSDHGECFGAHGRRAKNIFYEEAVRIPFLIRTPDSSAGKNDVCLNTVDIMPTLLELMNLPIPQSCEGSSKAWYLDGKHTTDDGCLMMCCGPTAQWGDGNEWRGYRNKQYTYAIYRKDGHELMFDHLNDPLQMKDLADDPSYATIKELLKSQMHEKMALINDNFEANSFYRDNWVKDRIILKTATQNPDLDIHADEKE